MLSCVCKEMTLLCLAVWAWYVFPVYGETGTELLYVQLLFRHGERAPIELYPNDPNSREDWIEGLGRLTRRGMRQHYAHGKFLREMYADFITTSPHEIDVLSSAVDRCLDSAECNLATFYAPVGKWIFEGDVDWQPIPIYYKPRAEDKYLNASSYCPRAQRAQSNSIESSGGQRYLDEHEEEFRHVSEYSGKNISSIFDVYYLFDALILEEQYNLIIPSWFYTYFDLLEKLFNLTYYFTYNNLEVKRLRAGPLLGLINEKMENKIHNKSIYDKKIQVYSGHDDNIAAVLQALNVYNKLVPPFCATLLFELHKVNEDYAVRLLYLNSSTPEEGDQVPHLLILDGCTEFCPLQYWKNYTEPLIPENWERECGISDEEHEKKK